LSIVLGVLAILFLGAIPLLPLCVRPLRTHRNPLVRSLGKLAAMGLLWLAFNCSLLTIWGALFLPEWWCIALGLPLLQFPAAWFSYRIAFGDT
jgi:hypothetical protein